MKALTVHQPNAGLIAHGVKRVENRSRRTHYRGPLLIHASKNRMHLHGDEELPLGVIVAQTEIIDCVHIEVVRRGLLDDRYPWLRTHAHATGPWCWILGETKALAMPVPARGAQNLWEMPWPPESPPVDTTRA